MAKRAQMIVFALALFALGFVVGAQAPLARAEAAAQGNNQYIERFGTIWDLVQRDYFDQPLDNEALFQGAVDGMLEELGDRHTSYMPPDEYEMLNDTMEGSYTGIGALVEAEGDRLLIVSPFDNSPAQAAGLLPGDQILEVDGTLVSTFEDPLSAVTLVRGPAGEPVTLKVRRGAEEFEVTIVRAEIPLISAEGEMLSDGIAYVRVADFGAVTVEQLRATLDELLQQSPRGMILDLRGNPGGSLDAAITVTSQFVGTGNVMIERFGDGREIVYEAEPGGLATDSALPLVVLVDAGSASASEIVAAAIQETGRGQLLGETTYGKGTVQNWHSLGAGAGGVRITIARWLTPNGNWVHEQGVTPDVPFPVTPEYRNPDPTQDLQVQAAQALLLGQALPAVPEEAIPQGGKLWKNGVPQP